MYLRGTYPIKYMYVDLRATAHAADPKLEAWNQWQLS